MLPDIRYEHAMLKNVIIRLDWVAQIPDVRSSLPKDIGGLIRSVFPIFDPREVIHTEINIASGNQGIVQQGREFYEWHFHNAERNKELTLTKDSLILEHKNYSSFEILLQEYMPIVDFCFGKFADLQAKRLGIRYLNHIQATGGNPLDWSELINPSLLYPLRNLPDNNNVLREITNIDFVNETFNIRFAFGIHNPDFPASIRQRIYILDLDGYSQNVLEGNQIRPLAILIHDKIQEYFEFSITDTLRERLHGRV